MSPQEAFKTFYLFIFGRNGWVSIAERGLSLIAASKGYSPVSVCGLLTAVSSVVVAHGLVVAAPRL